MTDLVASVLLSSPAVIVAVEMLLRGHLLENTKNLIEQLNKVVRVTSFRNVSDHWKELVLRKYAVSTISLSGSIVLNILFIIAPFFVIVFITGAIAFGKEFDLVGFLARVSTQVLLVIEAVIYISIRRTV